MKSDNDYKSLERFAPYSSFKTAAEGILQTLYQRLPFDLWMVTETRGNDWIVQVADDRGYNVRAGDVFEWSESFCYRMTRGLGPQFAMDCQNIPAYATAPIGEQVPIGAYIGIPLMLDNGYLYGTLCAIHPQAMPAVSKADEEYVYVQARLLSTLISSERHERAMRGELSKERHLSQVDELTGIYNLRGWKNFLEVEDQRCHRYKTAASVIMLDVDDLKLVNDSKGHSAGDKLLKKTANCLNSSVRPFDVACRIGGDEFAVLVVESSVQLTADLVKRIREKLDKARINASIGCATLSSGMTLDEVMEIADKNMYEEKSLRKAG